MRMFWMKTPTMVTPRICSTFSTATVEATRYSEAGLRRAAANYLLGDESMLPIWLFSMPIWLLMVMVVYALAALDAASNSERCGNSSRGHSL